MESPQLPPPQIAEGDLSSAGAGKVALCTVTAGHPHLKYVESLLNINNYQNTLPERHLTTMIFQMGGSLLHMFRNQLALTFLNEYNQEWALFMDDDIAAPHNVIESLLEYAHPVYRPIIGASYIHPLPQGPTPSVFYYDWDSNPHPNTGQKFKTFLPISIDRFNFLRDNSAQSMIPCESTGLGCVLIHRSVFVRFLQSGKWHIAEPFFATDISEYGVIMGEDHSFFHRCAQLGIPLYIRADIQLQHVKEGILQ